MIKELKQRNLFHFKQFKLYEDRLFYKNKNLFGSFELEIPFESLTNHVIYQKSSKPILWLFTGFFLIVFLTKTYYLFIDTDFDFGIYLAVITLLAITYTGARLGQKDVLLIKVGNPEFIEIYNKKPSENSVTEFHGLLRKASKDFLLNKYVYNGSFSVHQQKLNMSALQEIRIIDDVDFKIISAKIDGILNTGPMGFKIPDTKS